MIPPKPLVRGGLIGALTGCDLAPSYHPPAVAVPAGFKEMVDGPADHHAESGPWQSARPADAVPARALVGNHTVTRSSTGWSQIETGNQTLAGTLAVYDQARAFAQEAEAGLYPTVGVGGTITTNKQSAHRPLDP